MTGQDDSRGNPFPQAAIGEYKVITSNYKAEYDQISSAAVVAVTKSGTNEFRGSFFWDRTSEAWREPSPIEEDRGFKTAELTEQYGRSEDRRGGEECVSTCRYRCGAVNEKKEKKKHE